MGRAVRVGLHVTVLLWLLRSAELLVDAAWHGV
jgi:hypothetical protein